MKNKKESMGNYLKLTDEQLLQAMRDDSEAEAQLVRRYNILVKKCARPFFLVGGDSEDLIQEGMMGLLSAIRNFDCDKTASFRTYAEICIKNRLLSAIKSATRYKHVPLNDYVSLESLFSETPNVKAAYMLRELEEQVLAKESADELSNDFINYLSKFEADVLGLYLEGLSYSEIASRTNKTSKSADNAVQRIRKKLTQYLSSGEISNS